MNPNETPLGRGDACTLMAAAAELHGIAAVGMSRAS